MAELQEFELCYIHDDHPDVKIALVVSAESKGAAIIAAEKFIFDIIKPNRLSRVG